MTRIPTSSRLLGAGLLVAAALAALAFGAATRRRPRATVQVKPGSGATFALHCSHPGLDDWSERGRVAKQSQLAALQDELEARGILSGGERCVVRLDGVAH